MGEEKNQPFQLSFNASLKVYFQGSLVTATRTPFGLWIACRQRLLYPLPQVQAQADLLRR